MVSKIETNDFKLISSSNFIFMQTGIIVEINRELQPIKCI